MCKKTNQPSICQCTVTHVSVPIYYTHHGDLIKSLVTMSTTCFIPRAHTANWVSQLTQPKGREGIRENECEWTRHVETGTRKKLLAVGEACMAILWHAGGFKGKTVIRSVEKQRRHQILRYLYPTAGHKKRAFWSGKISVTGNTARVYCVWMLHCG